MIARAVDGFPVKVQAFNVVGQGEMGVIFTLAVEEMGQVYLKVWDPVQVVEFICGQSGVHHCKSGFTQWFLIELC